MMGGRTTKKLVSNLLRLFSNRGLLNTRQTGYTIIEVMIVLAVSGALFVSAVLLINGRQQRTQFDQSIREVRSQIQQTVNEVSNGFYPDFSNFTCTVTGSGPPTFALASGGQGTNEGCIFLGKAIQFGVEGTDPEEFRVLNIAGRQKSSGGEEAANLAQAQPRAIALDGGANVTVDISTAKLLLYGLETAWADAGVVAFTSSLSDVTSPSGGAIQQLNVSAVSGTTLGMSEVGAVQALNGNLSGSPQNPADGVQICFVSGGTDQSGLVTIGGSGGSLAVNLDIKSNRDCS
jgi:prepilin-type N-terminal cleavage/methylation domain-containing protein